MAAMKTRPRKTVDDFLSLPEGTLAELIDGELLMTPTPRERHQSALGRLHVAVAVFLQQKPSGRVYIAPFDVHLPSGDVVEPDLIYVSQANLHIIQDWVRGVPDLLVEVVSPTHPERDRLVKRALYARNGVGEFWIVDPEEKAVEVLVLNGDRYQPAGYFRESETLVSPLLPGFTLPLGPLFAP
ncbi:MAG TPA: Uma2 family endonuclease [Planctomycetota bacterium]